MKDVIEEMRAECAQDMWLAKLRSTAVDLLAGCASDIRGLGFTVDVSRPGGMLALCFDPDAPPRGVQGPLSATDAPERPDLAVVDPGDDFEVFGDAPEPEPKAESAPKPQPATGDTLRSGPFSEAEKARIVELAAAGVPARKIADDLRRKVGAINVMHRHLRDRIEAARAPAEDPGAPTPGRAEAGAPEARPEDVAPPPPAPDRQNRAAEPDAKLAPVIDGPATAARITNIPADLSAAMSAAERAIWAHLALNEHTDWTAASDLALAEGLARGDGTPGVAGALGVGREDVIARWGQINTKRGDLDHQAALLRVLRWRAGAR